MDAPIFNPVLFAASVAPLEKEESFRAAYRAASAARREKTDRLRRAEDQRLSLGAELLLRYALRAAGAGQALPELVYGAHGKPYLKDGGIFFSLSHSGEYVVCAVAGCEVGCDIEKITPVDEKLARRFFSPEESADIAAQPTQEEKSALFFRYWTAKESFLKATGRGLSLPLDAFRIVRGEELSVIQPVDDRTYRFKEFGEIPGYQCALCAAGECREASLSAVSLERILLPGGHPSSFA